MPDLRSSRYSDGATLAPAESVSRPSPSTRVDVCDSSRELSNEYEEMIEGLKLQQTSLLEELKRLREVYEQTKNESVEQTRQLKTVEDFYTHQSELNTHEQMEYLKKILQLFQRLRGGAFVDDGEHSSLDDLKSALNRYLSDFSSVDPPTAPSKEKSVANKPNLQSLSLLLNAFEQKFSHLLTSNGSSEFDETLEQQQQQESDDELEALINDDLSLKKFHSFLSELHEKTKVLCKDKGELEEKLLLFEEKRLTYSRWESQMYDILKWINEEKSARSHLKGLANKMAEELDQIRESTNPGLNAIGSNSSAMNTTGTGLGHNTVSPPTLEGT